MVRLLMKKKCISYNVFITTTTLYKVQLLSKITNFIKTLLTMSFSSSCAINKRRRLNNKVSTIFKNPKDEKQCISLIDVLNSCIQIEIDRYILKEIAEFSTGILIKCKHDLHKSIPHIDNFWIHHLRGNNFDKDNKENYENELLLYNYQCEDPHCSHEIHIFECKTCDKTHDINRYQENGMAICKPGDIKPFRSCSINKCDGIYCPKCCSKSGVCCSDCGCYYCNDCCKSNGGYCRSCSEYYCGDCAYFINEDDFLEYCDDCKWAIHVSQFGDERSRNKTVTYLFKKLKGGDKE